MSWTWIRDTDTLQNERNNPAYCEAWEAVRINAFWWRDNFCDTTDRISGWGHHYVCPKCAAHLKFDRERPEYHACPACGTVAPNTQEILHAWVYYYRIAVSENLLDAAVAGNVLSDGSLKKFVSDTVMWYAEHYTEFREHGRYDRGKIMYQSLDEAVWSHNLLSALAVSGLDPLSEFGQRLYHLLFLPTARLVMAQTAMIHNIPLWHVSFAASAALFFRDDTLYKQVMEGPFGVKRQISEGFSEDGVWFENSTTYHYYALEAATRFCSFLKEAGRDGDEPTLMNRIRAAYTTFPKIMFSDGILPSINDGWKLMHGIIDMGALYLMGARIFPEICQHQAMALLHGHPDLAKAEWLYGPPVTPEKAAPYSSAHLPSNCIAILRAKRIEVFTKYGNLSASHSHPDALEISISPFALDPGTTGYGSLLSREWYRSTAAHSTFAIDGMIQKYTARGSAIFSSDEIIMTVHDAYEGVTAKRRLQAADDTITDEFVCLCDSSHKFDWFFHGAGEFEVDGVLIPASIPENTNGYQFFDDIRHWSGGECQWKLNNLRLTLRFDKLPGNAEVFIMTSPDNPGVNIRHTVMVRAIGENFTVTARFRQSPVE